MTNILFVCLGNICRSPAAQGVMQEMVDRHGASARYHIDSAGTYSGHSGQLPDPRMRRHASMRGYNLTHRARAVRATDFDEFDLIIAMDDANYYDLRHLAPSIEAEQKIHRMTEFLRKHDADSVPDPYYEGSEGFEIVLNLLEDACMGLFVQIEKSQEQC